MIFYMKTIKLKKTKKTKKNKTSRRKMKGAGKRPREETPIKSFLKRIFRSSSSITIRDITLGRGEPTSPVYGNQDLSEDQIKELFDYALQIGVEFFASVWDIPSVDLMHKYTDIGKLPIPQQGSNHFKFLFFQTSIGNLSNISLTRVIGVNTSPNCFFSISFGFKQSFINSNND